MIARLLRWLIKPIPEPKVKCANCHRDHHVHDLLTNQCIDRGCECEAVK